MNQRPVADPIITALREGLREIAARRAQEAAERRAKLSDVSKRDAA